MLGEICTDEMDDIPCQGSRELEKCCILIEEPCSQNNHLRGTPWRRTMVKSHLWLQRNFPEAGMGWPLTFAEEEPGLSEAEVQLGRLDSCYSSSSHLGLCSSNLPRGNMSTAMIKQREHDMGSKVLLHGGIKMREDCDVWNLHNCQ